MSADNGCVHNQIEIDLDLSDEIDPVRWKRNMFVRFITVTHTIMSYPTMPQSLWLAIWIGIGYWNAYVTCLMGMA